MLWFNVSLLVALQTYPTLALITALALGLLVGSFLNVVIYRLPIMMENDFKAEQEALADHKLGDTPSTDPIKKPQFNLVVPASRCPHCGHKIRAWENIPVISYIFLRGKCSDCKANISLRYPSIELMTGILSVIVIYTLGVSWAGLAGLLFIWCLITLTMIDLDTFYLPDSITLPLLWLGLLVNSAGIFSSLASAVWGAAAGYLILWSIYHLFKLLTGKEGMGYGDFKLLAALGAWMGWQMLPQIILLSSLVGAVIGLSMIIFLGKNKNIPIPFGPYLTIAGFIAFIWGHNINSAYLAMVIPH